MVDLEPEALMEPNNYPAAAISMLWCSYNNVPGFMLFLALTHCLQQQGFPRKPLLFVHLTVYSTAHQLRFRKEKKKEVKSEKDKTEASHILGATEKQNLFWLSAKQVRLYRKVILRHSCSLRGQWASDTKIQNENMHLLNPPVGVLIWSIFSGLPKNTPSVATMGCPKPPSTHSTEWDETECLCSVRAGHSR